MAAAILIIAAVAAVLWLVPGGQTLVLSDKTTGRVYGRYPLEDGESFSITFVHSVNKTPVSDVYEARGGKLWLTGTVYYGFGAGVPDELGEGQTLTFGENGEMIVTGMDTRLDNVIYVVGTVYDHVLSVNGEEISLHELCGRNSKVRLRICGR